MPPLTFAQTSQAFGAQPTTPSQVAQQAAQSMQQAGITSLSGAGGSSGQTLQDKQEDFKLQQTLQNLGIGGDGSGDGSGDGGTTPKDEEKGLVETVLSNTMVANLLKGVQSTDRFFKNLAEKGVDGLTPEDKIILANLIGAGGLDKINIDKYADKYDVDVTELGEKFTQAASGLENVDYESLVDSYLSNKPTGIDSLTTMGSDLFNLFGDPRLLREDGSYTLEGLKEQLGPEGIAYLKATNPKLYYSFTDPQTSGGLAELAQFDLSTLGGSPEDRQLAARVVAAREATSGQGGQGGAQGIMAAAPVIPGTPVIPPVVPPVIPPVVPTTTTSPFDLAQFYANLPNYSYGKQGVMDPNLAQYYQNLNLFPRVV